MFLLTIRRFAFLSVLTVFFHCLVCMFACLSVCMYFCMCVSVSEARCPLFLLHYASAGRKFRCDELSVGAFAELLTYLYSDTHTINPQCMLFLSSLCFSALFFFFFWLLFSYLSHMFSLFAFSWSVSLHARTLTPIHAHTHKQTHKS